LSKERPSTSSRTQTREPSASSKTAWKESYKLLPKLRDEALNQLGIDTQLIHIDLFATHSNHQEPLYCTVHNSAWWYDWSKLTEGDQWLWANPPFSKILRVLTKIVLEPSQSRAFVRPTGVHSVEWRRLLDQLTIDRVEIPDVDLYLTNSEIDCCPSRIGEQ